jgi:hypothetical protein
MKLFVSASLALGLALSLAASGPVSAQDAPAAPGPLDHVQQVGAWTVSDKGSKPGDDSDREVTLSRTTDEVEVYLGRTANDGAGLSMKFSRCDGLNANSGFSAEGNLPARAAQIRAEIHNGFKEFAKLCPPKAGEEEALVKDLDAADTLLETWLHDRPYTYPPEEPEKPAPKGKKKK